MHRTMAIALVILSSLVCSECNDPVPAKYKWFYDLPIAERRQKFRALPVEEQIDIYLVDTAVHPKHEDLPYEIANGGINALPPLLRRLQSENNEAHKYYLLRVLEIMSERGYLKGRQDVIAQARLTASQIKLRQLKELSQSVVVNIERNSEK